MTCTNIEDRRQDLKQAILGADILALLQVYAEGIDFSEPLPDMVRTTYALLLKVSWNATSHFFYHVIPSDGAWLLWKQLSYLEAMGTLFHCAVWRGACGALVHAVLWGTWCFDACGACGAQEHDENALHLAITHDDRTSLFIVDFIIQNTNRSEDTLLLQRLVCVRP